MIPSNYPPGVTGMEPEIVGYPECSGRIGLWKTEVILQHPCTVDEHGDIVVSDGYKEELIDTLESRVHCSECGLLGADEFEAHGVSDDWEEA